MSVTFIRRSYDKIPHLHKYFNEPGAGRQTGIPIYPDLYRIEVDTLVICILQEHQKHQHSYWKPMWLVTHTWLVLCSWCSMIGAWCSVIGAWCLVLRDWCSVTGDPWLANGTDTWQMWYQHTQTVYPSVTVYSTWEKAAALSIHRAYRGLLHTGPSNNSQISNGHINYMINRQNVDLIIWNQCHKRCTAIDGSANKFRFFRNI